MPMWNGWTFVQTPAEAEAESIADHAARVARRMAKEQAAIDAEKRARAEADSAVAGITDPDLMLAMDMWKDACQRWDAAFAKGGAAKASADADCAAARQVLRDEWARVGMDEAFLPGWGR